MMPMVMSMSSMMFWEMYCFICVGCIFFFNGVRVFFLDSVFFLCLISLWSYVLIETKPRCPHCGQINTKLSLICFFRVMICLQ